METLNFSRWLDTKLIKSWLKLRQMDLSLADDLPEVGFIAVNGDSPPIAAGFLRLIEGKTAQIDSLITDPTVEPSLRNQAIDVVVERLLEFARANGVQSLIAFSIDAHTLERAKKHGFKHLPHTVMSLDIGGK